MKAFFKFIVSTLWDSICNGPHVLMRCEVDGVESITNHTLYSETDKKLIERVHLFCEQVGITRQLTAPYTPQQNGIVERRNSTMLNTTRSILNAMDMPQTIGRLKAFEESIKPKEKSLASKSDQLLMSYEDWQNKKRQEYSQGSGRGRGRANSRGRGRGRNSGGRGRGQDRGQTSYHQRKPMEKTKIKCFRCDAMGHYASDCPTRPAMEESNLAQAPDEGPALVMAIGEEMQTCQIKLNERQVILKIYEATEASQWFLNNGASNHMTDHQNYFSELDRNIKSKVRFGDGSRVEIEGKGDIILQYRAKETLEKVYADVCTCERRNRTVLNMTRSILKTMGLPRQFWAQGVRHSVYILNHTPTKALKDSTPYETFKGRKLSVGHLRVFGCIGYTKTLANHLKKLDDRSTKIVYLGNQPNTKAYRMDNPVTKRIHVTRDVFFDEAKGWGWKESTEEKTATAHQNFWST
ncbi:hypothetical protein E3N88_35070 [Mikania micrantha]|uniref:CCHC-type domain-containing protein n=1 Tax=Mikania micrantha TaxID=192012 RepID=A0A5N6LZY0_9ASTR|nr:hypothetical protein E3N88_35070 [Mikania micrantha]